MLDKHFEILRSAFIEAMYFADGADPEMLNDEGQYLDGQFSKHAELTERANQNINELLKTCLEKVGAKYMQEVTDRISLAQFGHTLYMEISGHGTGFDDLGHDLGKALNAHLYNTFYNSVHLEIWENDSGDLEFGYWENWN